MRKAIKIFMKSIAVLLVLFVVFIVVIEVHVARHRSRYISQGYLMKVGETLRSYYSENDMWPELDKWCDIIISSSTNRYCLENHDEFPYSINQHITEFSKEDLDESVVLLFDSKLGWNSKGYIHQV